MFKMRAELRRYEADAGLVFKRHPRADGVPWRSHKVRCGATYCNNGYVRVIEREGRSAGWVMCEGCQGKNVIPVPMTEMTR